MSSWDEVARDIRAREAQARQAEEARLEEARRRQEDDLRKVAEVDRMVKDFIRAARSADTPGAERKGLWDRILGRGPQAPERPIKREWAIDRQDRYGWGTQFHIYSDGRWLYACRPFEETQQNRFGRARDGLYCTVGAPGETLRKDLKRRMTKYMLDYDIPLPKE